MSRKRFIFFLLALVLVLLCSELFIAVIAAVFGLVVSFVLCLFY